jgi:hypothetical protein
MGVHPVTLSYMAFSYGRAFEEMAEAAMERLRPRGLMDGPLSRRVNSS